MEGNLNDHELLEKIMVKLDEHSKELNKISKYFMWQNIFAVFKVLLVIIPLIIGIIYLPPLLKNLFSQFGF